MSYTLEDEAREVAQWKLKHGRRIYLKPVPLPNSMKNEVLK